MSGAKFYFRSTISLWLRSEQAEMLFFWFNFIEALLEREFESKKLL
jgi:hypothetical protein